MSEKDPPAAQPPSQAPVFEIPPEALTKWDRLDPQRPLLVPLTRADLDQLFWGLRNSVIAQLALAAAVQSLSQGKTPEAEEEFTRFQGLARNSYSLFNTFIAQVMDTAMPEEDSHG